MGRTLGRGNFGTVIEGFASESGVQKLGKKSDSDSRLVIKRCVDERQAEIESYFNRRVRP